ncbi:FxsB family cyclophane-forming radical SAM/SPASM peptide maturase, partial [Streptomyces sp. NPDC005568]|uniref:FxsB family cyclophane-forming radical SAM/SPASM peptide maturase n=1 Tax=Streptomyces sp. NPDC005568 TaxID=3156887 RepID=UPI0033B64620
MGRPPLPLRQFVLKMHSRCDLACDHCYVFEHADQSWQGRPMVASDEVLKATAERIAEHAAAHRLDTVHVVLHGGEPLLAGRARLRTAAEELTRALDGVCALDLRIHTNGVTLDERFCTLFAEFGIKVGISLDGDKAANDLHRRYRDGRSSHDKVVRAVSLLNRPRYRHLFAGLLCTVDVRNEPVAVYEALAELTPPRVDFLLPHATWDEPPLTPGGPGLGETPYADWLLAVYDRWTADGRPMDVRLFDSVLSTLHGGLSLTESLGLAPSDLAVIETDGTFEQADSLKTAYDGAPATGLDVHTHTLDEVAAHPGVVARQQGLEGLCDQCRACPVVRSCGGGLYAHRYRSGSGFMNPSVYCADLLRLITDIRDRDMDEQLPLSDSQFTDLAAGFGTAGTVDLLARHQLAVNRELLAAVWRQSPHDSLGERAWETLATLDTAAQESVDTVLAHPYVRPWAVEVLRGDAGDGGTAATLALLSGGEQQMLAMGRALMSQPKLLMLDEPSMGL